MMDTRKQLWISMSRLWLDTELDRADLDDLARALMPHRQRQRPGARPVDH